MKKIIIGLAFMFTLSACSFEEVVSLLITPTVPAQRPRDTATPTVYQTPSNTPTITPIPTFTITPTHTGGDAELDSDDSDPDVALTVGALPSLYVKPTNTPTPVLSLGASKSIVTSLTTSSDVLIWGYCDAANYVDFKVGLSYNPRIRQVLLFMRLVDKGGQQSTAWGAGAIMKKQKGGPYIYRVKPENIAYYEEFKDAWIQYQIVAMDGYLRPIGRSAVYMESLSLRKCQVIEVDEE